MFVMFVNLETNWTKWIYIYIVGGVLTQPRKMLLRVLELYPISIYAYIYILYLCVYLCTVFFTLNELFDWLIDWQASGAKERSYRAKRGVIFTCYTRINWYYCNLGFHIKITFLILFVTIIPFIQKNVYYQLIALIFH